MSNSNYVRAKDVKQKSTIPRALTADVWIGGPNQIDDEGHVYITIEVQPAFGPIAAIRLSPKEMRSLSDLILERLGDQGDPHVPVQVTVPKGALVEVTYLSGKSGA